MAGIIWFTPDILDGAGEQTVCLESVQSVDKIVTKKFPLASF